MKTHKGGCHCGRIRFEVDAPEPLQLSECNCSICFMAGYLHLIVPKSRFRLLQGEECLTNYQFHSGVAQHRFCSNCGIKSFYIPRSHPEGISVNARCLDSPELDDAVVTPFDGRNWDENHHLHLPLSD